MSVPGRVPHDETFNNGATDESLCECEIEQIRSRINNSGLTTQQRNVLNLRLEKDLKEKNISTHQQARTLRNTYNENINVLYQENQRNPVYLEEQKKRILEMRKSRAERKSNQGPPPPPPPPGGSSSSEMF